MCFVDKKFAKLDLLLILLFIFYDLVNQGLSIVSYVRGNKGEFVVKCGELDRSMLV